MTSLPASVPTAHQVAGATVFLMNLTEPSSMAALTPPEWRLDAVDAFQLSQVFVDAQLQVLGVMTWLYMLLQGAPFVQKHPLASPLARVAAALYGVDLHFALSPAGVPAGALPAFRFTDK